MKKLIVSLLCAPVVFANVSFAATARKPVVSSPKVEAPMCPAWVSQAADLPLCPKTSTLLDATYPLMATVISDDMPPTATIDRVGAYVLGVLQASGDRAPMILLPVKPKTLAAVKATLTKAAKTPEQLKTWMDALHPVNSDSFDFQQDYLISQIDSKGQTQVRQLDFYNPQSFAPEQVTAMFQPLAQEVKACGVEEGAMVVNPSHSEFSSEVNGADGGNITALPGGICLIGDMVAKENWKTFASQFCPDTDKDAIAVSTNWLSVGHVDEVVTVVKNTTAEAPCDFSVVVASPRKAFELMSANPKEVYADTKNTDVYASVLLKEACGKLGLGQKGSCGALTNQNMADLLNKTPELKEANDFIQKKMDDFQAEAETKLKAHLPQCKIDFIQAPQVYVGQWENNAEGQRSLQRGLAILPNLSNSVLVNATVLSPEPHNASVKKYIDAEYMKRGLKTVYVETLPQHIYGSGNLHCMTNQIRKCRPQN